MFYNVVNLLSFMLCFVSELFLMLIFRRFGIREM